jgi:transcriptional regulator with XRE-family HTH domain
MGNKRSRPQRLAAKLLAIRQHLGISQIKLARLIDPEMSHTRVSEYEIGRREPNLMVVLEYAKAAGVSIESVIDDISIYPFNQSI